MAAGDLEPIVAAYIAGLDPASRSAAEISGDAYASLPWSSYASLMYPEFDLCAPLAERRRFDVVLCEQVLEHVVDPCAAAANLRKLCAPDGHVIVSTPFLIKVHELPMWGLRGLLAIYPTRSPDAARARGAGGGLGRGVGESTGLSSATWVAGRHTGVGIRCATSPTSRFRCGHSRETRTRRAPPVRDRLRPSRRRGKRGPSPRPPPPRGSNPRSRTCPCACRRCWWGRFPTQKGPR